MTPGPRSMNATEWGLLLTLSVLWGGAFFFAGVAIRELPPLTVVLIRVGLAAAILLPVFWFFGHKLPATWSAWWPFLVMGVFNNVLPFSFIFAGQTYVTVGLASIINALTPLFTVLVMAAFREERLTPNRLIGVVLGVLGVGILQGGARLADPEQIIGIGLCLCGALSYGCAGLWGRRHLYAVPPLKSATCQLICSSAMMLVIVSLIDQPWTLTAPTSPTIAALVALAAFGTAAAYIVFFQVLVRAGASNVMLVTLLIPVSAVGLGHVFLGEPIRLQDIAGAAVIGLGLLAIDGRLLPHVLRARRNQS